MTQQTNPKAIEVLIELDDISAILTREINDPVEARRLATASLKGKYGVKEGFSEGAKIENN